MAERDSSATAWHVRRSLIRGGRRAEGAHPVLADVKDIKLCDGFTQLYCMCQSAYQDGVFMIGCDSCDNWFHGPFGSFIFGVLCLEAVHFSLRFRFLESCGFQFCRG